MAKNEDITFRNLPKREENAVSRLRATQANLKDRFDRGVAKEEEKITLDRINAVLVYHDDKNKSRKVPVELVDPLFVAVRDAFNQNQGLLGKLVLNHSAGKIKTNDDAQFEDVIKISLVFGLLAADDVEAPRVTLANSNRGQVKKIVSDQKDPAHSSFSKAFFAAVGEMHGALPLAELTLSMLESEGDNDGSGEPSGEVDIVEFARVIRSLREKGTDENYPQLRRRINECLDSIQRVGQEKPLSDTKIKLPDLNDISDYQIQDDNVRLMGAIICSAMLEELKAFLVVDRLVEMSQNGTLPIGRGEAGEMLYKYWKETPNRMSEAERLNFYAITIGLPGGDANGRAGNRDFNDLWMRFVSSVSSLVRQKSVDNLLRQNIPAAIGQQQVRKSARDLALNLSAHGYGMALYAAIELQAEINKIIALLGHEDIKRAFGARDMWQVIDQVATLELGGAKNTAHYATLATCGAIITAWLANNVKKFNRPTTAPVIDLIAVTANDPLTAGPKATEEPSDYDLVNACELWLADTATSEDRIEQLAREPRESPAMTSKPIQIPSIAREMLEQAGIPGMGFGMGTRRQYQ